MQTEHEADRTTTLMRNTAEANACIATGDMLARLVAVMRGLRLDPQRMRANLDLGGGLIMAEAVMLELGLQLGRQHAHDAVYDAAQAAFAQGKPVSRPARRRTSAYVRISRPTPWTACWIPPPTTGLCADMAREGALARAVRAAVRAVILQNIYICKQI